MNKVGLTGNIGSGKTMVAGVFAALGIPVYNADNNAKKFLLSQDVIGLLQKEFGDIIIDKDNQIDKKQLANIVFNDAVKLNLLNSIIHPFVINDFKIWAESLQSNKYIILEAAILFESGYDSIADKIITVTCPEVLRIKRIKARDGISEQEIIERMNNQWKEELKVQKSDFIIVNDENQLIIPQIINIHKSLIVDS
jgi:dephospho-CoA kinase